MGDFMDLFRFSKLRDQLHARLRIAGGLSAFALLGSCSNGADVQRASISLATDFVAQQRTPPVTASVKDTNTSVALYIDGSRSMAGFAGCNTAPTRYDVIVDRMTTDLGITSVIRFGERSRGTGARFEPQAMSRAIHCLAFYDRLQNPDYTLYQRIASDSATSAHLYLTDGVQSDMVGTNQSPSVAALKSWVTQGNALAILAFRSDFAGSAWSEQRQQMLGTARIADRPFYFFIFGRTENAIEGVLSRLSQGLRSQATLIRFSMSGVHCTAGAAAKLTKYASSRIVPWVLLKQPGPAVETAFATLDCSLRPDYPLMTVLPKLAVEYHGWEGRSFGDVTAPPTGTSLASDSVVSNASGSKAIIRGVIPVDARFRYAFVGLHIDLAPGALRPFVDSLSTDFDSNLDSFDRTYRFSWLVEQLAGVQLARQPWVPFTMTVQFR